MNAVIEGQAEFSAILAEVLETNDLDKAFHQTRKLCHLGLTQLKDTTSYYQLVKVAARHPHCAGMIYDRMSKVAGLETQLASIVYKAAGYIEEMTVAGTNGKVLTKAHLSGIASVASFNAERALKALAGFGSLSYDVSERVVVDTMMNIVNKHPEIKICGLGYAFSRGTYESLMIVGNALTKEYDVNATALTTKVLASLGRVKIGEIGEEKDVCDVIKNIAVRQNTFEDAMSALVTRRSEESYETLVSIITGVNPDEPIWRRPHPLSKPEHALHALNLIIADKGRRAGALNTIQTIASVNPTILDPVARAFFMEVGSAEAQALIAKLKNDDGDTKEFLENQGGEAAIAVWESKVESGRCASGTALKGLLTLRFNVANGGQKNMEVFNNAVKNMADKVCTEMAELIYRCEAEGNIDEAMNGWVFGKNDDAEPAAGVDAKRDWVEDMKATFDQVANDVGYNAPRAVLEKAVEVIEAQERLAHLSNDMNGLLRHLKR